MAFRRSGSTGTRKGIPVPPKGIVDTFQEKILRLRPSVKADYLKSQFMSKFVSDDTDPADVRRARAVFKWLLTERENEATNTRLLTMHEEYNILPRVSWARFRDFCRQSVTDIIGESAPVEALIGSFSGGASTSRNRTKSYPSSKYLGKAHVTSDCLGLFSSLLEEMPGWLGIVDDFQPEIVSGNVMFTVPKKTDIDRVACKEPDINMFIQKGIGSYFRSSLRRIGINLNDQRVNQSLARVGSIDGSLSTLDLSSASDSVSTQLVFEFLPECWYTLLDTVRCRVTSIPDGKGGFELHRNEMFSSMGNGFTFELESLLFYVIVRAVAYFKGVSGVVSVYGDDIICPTRISDDVVFVLGVLGFQVNPDKSFTEGPFRESCGGHYHDGIDITPFYVKEPISRIDGVIHLANSLRKWANIPGLGVLDPEVEEIWLWLKSLVPEHLWGGGDLAFKFQLVSLDTPCSRIQVETTRLDTGLGGYFHWLNTTWDRHRLMDGVETSSRSQDLGRLRLRPVRLKAVPQLPAQWIHEINGLTPSMCIG